MSTVHEPSDLRRAAAVRAHARTVRSAVPPTPAHLVPRERLLTLVDRGVRGPLTLVSASAGTGKTTLVSSWAGRDSAPGPVAWLTLDGTSRRPRDFWAAVVGCLVDVGLDLGPGVSRVPAGDLHRVVLDPVARGLARRDEPLVLVLDEGDALSDRELGTAMGDLLRDARGRLRLVLATRTDPFLPLHRYRLDGDVSEIRGADLAFDPAEQAELVRRHGLRLSDAGAATLLERTGGWPVAVEFAAMVLAGRPDAERAVRELRGDGGELAAYFVREVLATQPADLREVLLRTSVVDDLRPGLVEALTGLPARGRVLELMAHGNAFLQPLPGSPGSFRFQSLFREFLRAQLADEHPALVPELHRRAADWYAQHDRPLEARRHTAAAGAAEPRLVTPAVTSPGSPAVPVVPPLHEDEPADAPTVSLRLAVVVLDAHRALLRSDAPAGLAALARADRLCRRLDPRTLAAHPEIPALLALCRGRLLLLGGDTVAAREELARASRTARAPGCEELLATSLRTQAVVEVAAGRLRAGADLLLRADTVARGVHDGLAPGSAAATVLGAWVGSDALEAEAGRRWERGAAEARARRDDVTAAVLTLARARLPLAVDPARRPSASPAEHLPGWLELWLEAASAPAGPATRPGVGRSAPPDGPPTPVTPVTPTAPRRARALVVAPHRTGAGPRDASLGTEAAAASVLDRQVTTWLAESARAAESGDLATATAALERSLRLAAPKRLSRPFHRASPAVRRLLLELDDVSARYPWLHGPAPAPAAATRPSAVPSARPAAVPTVRRHGAPPPSATLWEPLTHRETEVLGLLADLLNTEEIAASMYVSVNTVRTHVRSILRKLEVSRRNEAVRRAWELGVLPAGGDLPVPAEDAEATVAAPRVG